MKKFNADRYEPIITQDCYSESDFADMQLDALGNWVSVHEYDRVVTAFNLVMEMLEDFYKRSEGLTKDLEYALYSGVLDV